MRAADSDRQFVAEQLQKALNEGRLSLGEYDDRLQEAYAARTYGELDGLLQDLPTVIPADRAQLATPPAAADQPVAVPGTPGRRAMPGWLVATWGSWLSTSLVCTVIWLA